MINVLNLMDHIVEEVGVSRDAANSFKVGYMSGIIDDLMLRIPEAREFVESHARKYKFDGVDNG